MPEQVLYDAQVGSDLAVVLVTGPPSLITGFLPDPYRGDQHAVGL